jgi:ATP-binding cassette subfamily B protein/ATP-binding cassette subfamily C protein LapB
MTFSGLVWPQALALALTCLGKDATRLEGTTIQKIEKDLQGQGLSVRKQVVDAPNLPEGDFVAALLALPEGRWLPLIPGEGSLRAYVADGQSQTIANCDGHLGFAYLLTPHIDPLDQVLPFLRRHKTRLLEIMLAGFLVNFLSLFFPLFGSFVYDKVLGNGLMETLWALAIGLILILILNFALQALRYQLFERFSESSEADIDLALFENVLGGHAARLPSVGLVLDKYKQILGSRDFLASGYLMAALDLPFLLLFLLAIVYVSGPLVFVPLTIGALLLGAHLLMSVPTHDYESQARRAGERRFSLLADVLTAHEAIVGAPLRDDLKRRWRRASVTAGRLSGKARYWHALLNGVSLSFSNLAYVSVLVAGAYMVEERLLTSGGLIAASMLTSRSIGTLTSLVLLFVRYREFRLAMRELDALFPRQEEATALAPRQHVEGRLQLTGVSCHLRAQGRPTLKNIDLSIHPGEAVALVGRPGAGKTTLLRLMAGVMRPDDGQVMIDHIPVAQLNQMDVGRFIGYKPQEPALFEGSLEDAILGGRQDLGPQELQLALVRSGLEVFLERGELTLATPIGPRGSFLSGGQRQMVALARALLGAPRLLLLDEPTTGLDGPLERHLADALAPLKGSHTLIISTHSRSLLQLCDRVVVIEQGKIGADGPRDRIITG